MEITAVEDCGPLFHHDFFNPLHQCGLVLVPHKDDDNLVGDRIWDRLQYPVLHLFVTDSTGELPSLEAGHPRSVLNLAAFLVKRWNCRVAF